MNKVILIIDDDKVLRETLARGLRNVGFSVICADSAENGSDVLSRVRVDVIILDRMMTGQDGLSFLNNLRKSGDNTPVIMLTAMGGAENAIDGLSGGADDYMAKPFQFQELVLRIQNIVRKSAGAGNVRVLPAGLTIVKDEFFTDNGSCRLDLSGEEKKLLNALVSPVGNIVAASPMVAKRLRTKLNVVLSNVDIVTVRGRGYKIIDKNGE
ncbi:MAG: response regulator transcription factor [Proteobacteria bacterium]|nr:response regulator transcription factor [Candidatus Enterousia scatequi]